MGNTQMWNNCQRENDLQTLKQIKIPKKMYQLYKVIWILSLNICLLHTWWIDFKFPNSVIYNFQVMKRCFDWGPHGSWKHDLKYIQVMVANLWFFSKEPITGTLMKLVEICSEQVFFTFLQVRNSNWPPNMFWSVTVYNKTLSSQCNVTAQIEQVQYK